MRITLEALETLVAIAEHGSFARAADRLGVGRSSVSRHVQRLEDRLDARLFQRTTRSMSLTREGELFYENCRPGIEHLIKNHHYAAELRGTLDYFDSQSCYQPAVDSLRSATAGNAK